MVSQHSLWNLLQRPLEHFACHKALAIPEILEHIFRYLDEYIIRHVIALVCRQWLCIARQLLPPQIDWALNFKLPEHQRTLEILPSARILSLVHNGTDSRRICDSYPDSTYRNAIWSEILKAIQDIQAKEEGSKLRELIVWGDLLNHRYFQDLLPYQSRTSVLKLKDLGFRPGWEFLHKIFMACPMLDELHVECWNFPRSYSPVANEDLHQGPSEPFPVIPLRVLNVNGFVISQGCMEAILEAVPRLVEFRVVGAWKQRASPEAQPTNGAIAANNNNTGDASASPTFFPPDPLSHVGVFQDFDYSAFFHLVARSCQRLRRFHFSIHDQRYTENDIATLLGKDFPALRERSFSQDDLPILMKRILPSSASTTTIPANPRKPPWSYITTLELIPLHENSEVTGCSLQSYLCTAVHLRCLIAPNVLIDVSNVKADIPKSGVSGGSENPGRKIWACRNLHTLHISFKGTVQEFAARSTSVTIFGYISIVCPRLVDLQIRGYFMNLTQSGGLCLLSRLRDLEKLTIVAKKCLQFSKKDMAWIRPLPTLMNRLTAMPTVLKPQNLQGQQTVTTEAAASGNGSDSKAERLGSSQNHNDDIVAVVDSVVDWSSIARANNLEEWARERDFEAWQGKSCLPRLVHFQILVDNSIKESCRHAEHFMKEIRPHTKIELRSKNH
ncbi:hypothetical protein BGZ80_005640 [Entomortierella chlamydospora]|uniref:F-box domain-containing protein n=1 Tax=Entomortierella chlamydospora TaxID=101097 RepID=A0A9P6T263_9FUNG|nr:hypothetical protein BGZ79_001936 [Entomortierella chlamydospora]KAG0019539.1 hypothetical protein BGZ80_005640 [Entomortierella chlamydospora]